MLRDEARQLWARTSLRVWPERYRIASLPPAAASEGAALVAASGPFAALVIETDEVSLTVSDAAWEASPLRTGARAASGPLRAITFLLNVDLGVCGYLAPAADRLAADGVSIVPQCAYLKDHVLVREEDLARAVEVLEALIAGCRGAEVRGSSS